MHQILLCVGGVHHQQIVVRLKHIEVGIVHGAAVLIGDDAVLCQTHIQCRHVAGQHVLQKGLTLRTLNEQSSHVGHIEQTAHLPGIQVLGNNAGGVLNGHLPSAEVHHFRTGGHMDVIQLGTLQLAHTFFLLQDHGSFLGSKKGHKTAHHGLVPPLSYLRDSLPTGGCTFGGRASPSGLFGVSSGTGPFA